MADQPPPWLATMRQITGTHVNDNPVILGWAKKIGELFPDMASYCAQYNHDRIAWCGLTVGYCMAVNGVRPVFGAQDVDKFLYALAWRQFGKAIDGEPQLGDVLIFDFGGGDHHVTLYEQTQGNSYICRGGNQNHQVMLSTFAKTHCIGVRRPPEVAAGAQTTIAMPAVRLFSGITATVFGGAADQNTSAYDGHVIDDSELGVALPFHFPSPRPQVRVWNGTKSVVCNVVDVGPWNTNDPYWQTGARPEAESGVDNTGRRTNLAGIDLTPAAAAAVDIAGKGIVAWEFVDVPAVDLPEIPSLAVLRELIQKLLERNMPSAQTTPSSIGPGSAPTDIGTLIQQVLKVVQTFGGPAVPAQPPANGTARTQDQIQQIVAVLTGLISKDGQLGPVNGALGQTIGNLLNGKKSAIGVIGSLVVQLLSMGGNTALLGPVVNALGGAAGLSGVGLPIFLAIAAWGVLGKLEKWTQAADTAKQ
jgi:hypothetical protein